MGPKMNRRSMLATIGLASAYGGSVAAIAGVIDAKGAELHRLIERHRTVREAWDAALEPIDVAPGDELPNHAELVAAADRLQEQEEEATEALLSYRPQTLNEVRTVIGYMRERKSAWSGCVPREADIERFFDAIMGGRA